MNRAFMNKEKKKGARVRQRDQSLKQVLSSFFLMKKTFLVNLTFTLLVLTWSLPAMAGQCEIVVGPGWLKGGADAVPLGNVLAQVAEKTGYAIYIDEKLEKVPATFSIKEKLEPEKAIQRMIRPHSYAVVFGSKPDKNGSNILELRVFRNGQPYDARYVGLHKTSASASAFTSSSSGFSTKIAVKEYAAESGRYVDGKNMIRRDFHVTKSPFGTPVVKFRDPAKGPDYRPSSYEMRQAYERYQQAKKQKQHRDVQALNSEARSKFEQQRESYRTQRNQMLKQYAQNTHNNYNNK